MLRPTGVLAVAMAVLAALSGCETDPAPTYEVQETFVRLIPERGTIGAEGGALFTLLELSTPEATDLQKHALVALRGVGASIQTVPGATTCSNAAGDDADEDAGLVRESLSKDDILLPARFLRRVDGKDLLETGIVITIPKGTTDALIEAAVYRTTENAICSINADAGAADAATVRLVAFTSFRISREVMEAPDGGGSMRDASMPSDASADAAPNGDE